MTSTAPLSTSTAPAAAASSDSPTAPTSAAAAKAKRSAYNDTALHVLKGAVVNILGPSAAVTASVAFSTPYKGTLSVVWAGDALSLDTITAIEHDANRIIQAALPVQSFTLPRKEAEQRYTAAPVNHTYIYDRFPVPDSVDPLSITLIDGVNVNCCMGPHTATTAELRRLRVLKAKKGKVKDKDGTSVAVIEFLFLVHEGAEESFAKSEEEAGKSMKAKPAAAAAAAAAAPAVAEAKGEEGADGGVAESGFQPAVKRSVQAAEVMPAFGNWRAGQPSHVREEVEAVLQLLQKRLAASGGVGSSADEKNGNTSLEGLDVELERRLVMFSNICYTMGFTAAREVHTVDRAAML
ncbi:hypothetical protein MMC34_008516 [Xylographa carneopallida]|nr:hypothetical protein [Xylographa carneopallida]